MAPVEPGLRNKGQEGSELSDTTDSNAAFMDSYWFLQDS